MKVFAAGLCALLAGVVLWGINWLGAAAALPVVTEWSGTRMNTAWKVVGHGPLVAGILLIALGLALVLVTVVGATKVDRS